jgi:hypothetical protein
LDVKLNYGYWIDEPATSGSSSSSGSLNLSDLATVNLGGMASVMATRNTALNSASISGELAFTPATLRRELLTPQSSVVLPMALVTEMAQNFAVEPNFRSADILRSIPFTFDPELAQNRSIYASIRASAGVGERWESTAFGFVRRSGIANTVYRLPDEIRLAYSADLKAPHMIPVLFRDAATDEMRVRVVMQAVPYHDPQKLVDLSDFLYNASGGGLAAPKVISGGYKEAKLTLTGAFPEQITALKGKEFSVELEGSFELVLDLTLEFYRFLCELLEQAGLTGEVVVTLENPPAPDAPTGTPAEIMTRRVPMRLTLDDVTGLPLEMRIPEATISPGMVEVINRSGLDLQVGGCAPRLLQIDENSVVPLEVYKADTVTSFPATLPSDQTLSVEVKPKLAAEGLLWNAVQVELLNLKPTLNAEALLNRVHELAPSGSLTLDLEIISPAFAQGSLPAEFAGKLFRLVVEITRPGFGTQQVTLSLDTPETKLGIPRTLQDLVSAEAAALLTFSYRVKNVYFTKEGAWSELRQEQGSTLFAFPNPVEV